MKKLKFKKKKIKSNKIEFYNQKNKNKNNKTLLKICIKKFNKIFNLHKKLMKKKFLFNKLYKIQNLNYKIQKFFYLNVRTIYKEANQNH